MADLDVKPRRRAIAEILRSRSVGTQQELRELVLSRGFDVTQATLSRDLQKLRARRISLPDGGSSYELVREESSQPPAGDSAARLRLMRDLVLGIVDGEALVVMHTRPGAAPAIAALLDETRLTQVIGTLAGDDTIFIVPEKKTPARKLARRLATLFARETIS